MKSSIYLAAQSCQNMCADQKSPGRIGGKSQRGLYPRLNKFICRLRKVKCIEKICLKYSGFCCIVSWKLFRLDKSKQIQGMPV